MCAFVFDYRCRKDVRLTLITLKTYEDRGPTFQFFGAFSIILIDERNFQVQFPAKFVEKRIAQMAALDGI